jgi:hypothetical protein
VGLGVLYPLCTGGLGNPDPQRGSIVFHPHVGLRKLVLGHSRAALYSE